ncbi:glycosyltransferase involved in cell wall biosynthesis [Lachnotalea glycerini]|uniref:Glycosyltransferase involved in cell wall biosynthesis n=1 Tax=Lachnotalea glycerini TaxID=1763509 RepID=A0A318EKI7_9FIRM|nr:glycosyltransferase family 2 protein [Lachnotalea glycerini]PXV87266.1 glycosyltransferase involved in cell wall biosynthesis [Lachnotalea glycerini]
MGLLTVIVPCYNEEQVIEIFYSRINEIFLEMKKQYNDLKFQLLFVNDGSKDNTLPIIRELAKKDDQVEYVSFSRNFGKEAAMYAGLKNAVGDYVAVMDADLQDPPEFLIQMYQELLKGSADCVAAKRETRKGEPVIRSFFARMFYKGINKISKTEIVDGARDFRLMTRQMVDAILQMTEYNRFSKGIFGWVGFETKWIGYKNVERAAGNTKWSFWKLLIYALDGVIAFSTAPLVFATVIGLLFCVIALIMIIIIITKTILLGDPVAGYPSMICVIFLLGGIQLFCMGIIGQYLSKAYLEIKKRPIYIEKEKKVRVK